MARIYIAKSSNGGYDSVMLLKEKLKSNHTILEHNGGKYDPSIVQSADIIIIVPSEPINDNHDDEGFFVGRGQYEMALMENKKVFILRDIKPESSLMESAKFCKIDCVEIHNENDYRKYGIIYPENYDISYGEFIDAFIKSANVDPVNNIVEQKTDSKYKFSPPVVGNDKKNLKIDDDFI